MARAGIGDGCLPGLGDGAVCPGVGVFRDCVYSATLPVFSLSL